MQHDNMQLWQTKPNCKAACLQDDFACHNCRLSQTLTTRSTRALLLSTCTVWLRHMEEPAHQAALQAPQMARWSVATALAASSSDICLLNNSVKPLLILECPRSCNAGVHPTQDNQATSSGAVCSCGKAHSIHICRAAFTRLMCTPLVLSHTSLHVCYRCNIYTLS